MSILNSSLKICRVNIAQCFEKSNVIIAFGMGIIFSISGTAGLRAYSHALQQKLTSFEPWIYLSSECWSMMFIYLGGILLVGDAPFISGVQTNIIWRTSRISWVIGQLLYIFIMLLMYFISLNTAVFLLNLDSIQISANWSDAFNSLSDKYSLIAFERFKISYPFQSVFILYSPIQAWLLSLLMQVSYCFFADCILFTGQLISRKNIGWICTILIHLIGYIYLQEPYSFLARVAFPVHSMLGYSFVIQEIPSISKTLSEFWILILGIHIFLLFTAQKTDLISKEEE